MRFVNTLRKAALLIPLFVAGFLIGTFAARSQPPQTSSLEALHNVVIADTEKIEELRRNIQDIHDWIVAHDRQAINDDIGGTYKELKTRVDWLDRLMWGCLTGIGVIFIDITTRSLLTFRKAKNGG